LTHTHTHTQAFVFFEQKTDGHDVLRRASIVLALQVRTFNCYINTYTIHTYMYEGTDVLRRAAIVLAMLGVILLSDKIILNCYINTYIAHT
jgi:hypothetical protein